MKRINQHSIIHDLPSLRKFFTPGNIVPSYGGFDRVIRFNEPIKDAPYPANHWSVYVCECDIYGAVKGHQRCHATAPNYNNYKLVVKD